MRESFILLLKSSDNWLIEMESFQRMQFLTHCCSSNEEEALRPLSKWGFGGLIEVLSKGFWRSFEKGFGTGFREDFDGRSACERTNSTFLPETNTKEHQNHFYFLCKSMEHHHHFKYDTIGLLSPIYLSH